MLKTDNSKIKFLNNFKTVDASIALFGYSDLILYSKYYLVMSDFI